MSVVTQTREHFIEELTSQKSAYEAKLRMRNIDGTAAFETGAINGGYEPVSDSSDLAAQLTTLELSAAQQDLDESRTRLADDQFVSSRQRGTISQLQQSLQNLSIANSKENSAYAALQNENRSPKAQNTSLAQETKINRTAAANSQSQPAQHQRQPKAIINDCTSGAEKKLQEQLEAAKSEDSHHGAGSRNAERVNHFT
ncbi:hypothetical protein AC579_10040 [Pseudocercospora musae]|uniref:Uncharacterized protein n=1 Tax=Pseudocercospora musae TaxID=113226 RepID=A0A139IH50_9PEZI|nr:hypothetical protein AC579_10040 [Pseudocercospora musae]